MRVRVRVSVRVSVRFRVKAAAIPSKEAGVMAHLVSVRSRVLVVVSVRSRVRVRDSVRVGGGGRHGAPG